ncbi:protein of unknown function (plasmid) [Azospirillum lipoferum 4B]|uniref:Uncharacterized protein n=1 Tax=Azospirillum lipoferum (strain 4B) TaxID=862719 RepID=G7ZG17_AZOL4|nr:protein of unknown function [Azospirillum lipoferum 4B]
MESQPRWHKGNGPPGEGRPVPRHGRSWSSASGDHPPRVLLGAGVPTDPTVLEAGGGDTLALWLDEHSALAIPAVRSAARPNNAATTGLAP